MNKFLGALSTLLVTTTFAFIGEVAADTSVQIGVSYRSDEIDIKQKVPNGCDGTAFFDSETKLRIKDIEIVQLNTRVKSSCGECFYFRGDFNFGWIVDGRARESNRFQIALSPGCASVGRNTLYHRVDRKYTADFDLAIGIPLEQCWCSCLQLIPTLGFAYDTQHLKVRRRDDSSFSDESASNDRRGGSLRTTWWGPWIGVDFAYCNQACYNFYGEFEYHFGTRCRRHRNADFGILPFNHHNRTRSADGYNLRLGSIYFFKCNWFADGHFNYRRYTSNHHRDRVLWRSYEIGVDVGRTF